MRADSQAAQTSPPKGETQEPGEAAFAVVAATATSSPFARHLSGFDPNDPDTPRRREIDEVLQYQTYFSKLVEMIAPDFVRCHDFDALQTAVRARFFGVNRRVTVNCGTLVSGVPWNRGMEDCFSPKRQCTF